MAKKNASKSQSQLFSLKPARYGRQNNNHTILVEKLDSTEDEEPVYEYDYDKSRGNSRNEHSLEYGIFTSRGTKKGKDALPYGL